MPARQRKPEPTTEKTLVTPEIAHTMMGKNVDNRNVRQGEVNQIARDIVAGKWIFNGDSVKFDYNDNLIDGQHRLLAVIKAKKAVWMNVTRNLEPEAKAVTDTGARRSMADTLRWKGNKSVTTLASVIRRGALWDQGFPSGQANIDPSREELLSYFEAHSEELIRATDIATASQRAIFRAPSLIGLCYYVCARIDEGDAQTYYVTNLINGENIDKKHPAFMMRNKFISSTVREGRLRDADLIGYTIRSWNAWRKNENLQRLNPPKGRAWNNETIPKPL